MIPTSMKRRRFFQAALALPAGSALLAQQPVPAPGPPPGGGPGAPGPSGMEYPKIDSASPDQAAAPILHFFSAPQLAALKRLSDLLMPGGDGKPGALDA